MDESEKGKQTPAPPPEIHRLDPMDFKIYTLAKNPWLWLNSCKNL